MKTTNCFDCPRSCGANRSENFKGACGMGENPVVARACVHMWEEPPVSGTRGSGAVFFSGCALNCVFCQNNEISHARFGKEITVDRLKEIYRELKNQGVHNINLVNPTHFLMPILQSLNEPLGIPVVYNCGGYESVNSLKLLEGKVQIYLPDMKYSDNAAAKRYSRAGDYFETACAAIKEMYRQVGDYVIDDDGIMQSGVIIRHLVLPGNLENTFGVIDWVAQTFPAGSVMLSLMSQYTPCGDLTAYPEIARRLTKREYQRCEDYLFESGFEDGYMQELSSAKEEYIPDFNLEGV